MPSPIMGHVLACIPIGIALGLGACGGSDTASNPGQDASASDTGADGASDVGAADTTAPDGGMMDADAAPSGSLTVTLDPSIDIGDDTVKATILTTVDLLDATGTARAHATISNGTAVVSLAGISSGDYFLRVNGDADDLVPTRVDNPSAAVLQRVGTTLRRSQVGPEVNPAYCIDTYPTAVATGVVKFSDGTAVAPAEPVYAFITQSPGKIEFKVLGTASPVSSYTAMSGNHPSNGEAFHAWIANTNGTDAGPAPDHHGDMFNADGGAATCSGCHANMGTKPATYASITSANGWCFKCHFGTGGSGSGFVDPTK